MSAASETRLPLGALMVRVGLITQSQLEHALLEQAESGRPLGEVIVTLGYASPGAVANALAEQYGGTLKTEYGVSSGLGRRRPAEEHVLIVSSSAGEAVVKRAGACPAEGTVIEDAQGRRFKVARVGVVRCAYLVPAQ